MSRRRFAAGEPSRLLLIAILLVGAGVRFYAIGAKTVWLDEAFSIWIARHPLPELWQWLIGIDQHPPLYYTLLHVWQSVWGDREGAVRMLSAFCGVLTLPVFYVTTRRFFDAATGLLATLILALSPFHVRFAQEARMYTLLTLAAAFALYCAVRLLTEPPGRAQRAPGRAWALGLGVAQAAVMLTHNTATVLFPLALNLPALGGYYLVRRRGQASSLPGLNDAGFLSWWLAGQLVALALWLPWARPFVIQARGVDQQFWILPPTLATVYDAFHNFHLAFLPAWFPAPALWDLFYGLLALAGIWGLRHAPARLLLLLSLFLVPVFGELLVSLRRPIFYERTLIWATLPYYMLLAFGMRRIGMRVGRAQGRGELCGRVWAAQALAALAVVGLSSVSLWAYYDDFQKEEWAQAAAYVAARVEPGELILFNATWVQIPFEYYFREYHREATLHGMPVDLFDRGVLEPKMTSGDIRYLEQLISGRDRVWLVYSHDWYTDPDGIIPRELGSRLRLTDRREFVGLEVMEFEAAGKGFTAEKS